MKYKGAVSSVIILGLTWTEINVHLSSVEVDLFNESTVDLENCDILCLNVLLNAYILVSTMHISRT